jgi:hypothetical protein
MAVTAQIKKIGAAHMLILKSHECTVPSRITLSESSSMMLMG